MKRFLAALMLLWMVSALPARAQVTIESFTLMNALNNDYVWTTAPISTEWILGVSDQPTGPLLNGPDSRISHLPLGRYWLFADPAMLGKLALLSVQLSDGRTLAARFRVKGSNGSERQWRRLDGSAELSLGWAPGVIDLVGTTNGTQPDGVNDLYLDVMVGAPAQAGPDAE